MLLVLRALARLVTFLLLVVLAAAGLCVAVFSLQGGDDPLSLANLAELLRLPGLRDDVGDYLSQLEADGPLATVSALAGAAAVLVSVLLLVGALALRRERMLVLDEGDEGRIVARPKAFEQLAAVAAEESGATRARAKLHVRRGGHAGRLDLSLAQPRTERPPDVEQRASTALAPLVTPFRVEPRIRAIVAAKGARVR